MSMTAADRAMPSPAAPTTIRSRYAWAIIAVLAVVAASRSTYLLTTGRFWAEEGTVWFARMARDASPAQLLFVNPRTGYLLSIANVGAWLAALVPVRYAPLAPTWISLGVLLTVVWVILRWPSEVLTTRSARLVAAALVVVGPLAAAEAWLNTTNVQTYLGILALLLLFVPVDELDRRHLVVAVVALAVAASSGLWAAALAPLFVILALRHRTRRRLVVAAVTGSLAALQVGLLIHATLADNLAESRSTGGGLDQLIGGPARHHLMGFAGGIRTIRLVNELTASETTANLVAVVVAALVIGIVGVGLWRSPRRKVPLLLVAALVIVEVLVQVGSIGGGVGGRYSVMPIAIVTLMAIYAATNARDQALRIAASVLVACSLLGGLAGFWTVDPTTLRCVGCPSWAEQVERWEAGGSRELEIWPYDEDPWVVRLLPPDPPG